MKDCFPGTEIEKKMTLYPEGSRLEDIGLMVRTCVKALCNMTVSVSREMTGVINNPVHRFVAGERRFRIQGENPKEIRLGGRTYPVWRALFKSSKEGDIGEQETNILIASQATPSEIGTWLISPDYGVPEHLGHYLKTKMGHDITTRSGRTFHICVDQCIIPGGNKPPLYQIEVEYKYSPSESAENETLEKIQAEIDEIIGELNRKITLPHTIGGPKKGKWFLEAVK